MEELKKLAQRYEDKAAALRAQLELTNDNLDRMGLLYEIKAYQSEAAYIYERILQIQKQN